MRKTLFWIGVMCGVALAAGIFSTPALAQSPDDVEILENVQANPEVFQEELVEPELAAPTVDTSTLEPATDQYARARVEEIVEEGETTLDGIPQPFQKVRLRILTGPEKGQEVTVDHGTQLTIRAYQKVKVGQQVVLLRNATLDQVDYYIGDTYRTNVLFIIFGGFIVLILFFGRLRGLTSLLGLGVSIAVVVAFMIPQIMNGKNPLFISIVSALAIAVLSLTLAHGFRRRTWLALWSTLVTLGIAIGLAVLFVKLAGLHGAGTEEAFYLQFGPLEGLNLQGLLLGGIIIGVLGVLDDVTTSQTAAIDEIHRANPALQFKDLYARGLSVGKEHIASLVNTLVLAYAGASFPLLLLFTVNTDVPLWVTLNSESIAEEIIRTLVGSSALVLAVPIATVLAAYVFSKRKQVEKLPKEPSHRH